MQKGNRNVTIAFQKSMKFWGISQYAPYRSEYLRRILAFLLLILPLPMPS